MNLAVAELSDPRVCAVCGSRDPQTLVFRVRGYAIWRCSSCGVGRTELPAGYDPSSIYDDTYFQGGQDDGYADYRGSRDVLRHEFRGALSHLARAGVSEGRLLEVGCAYGFFLDEARSRFDVCGVELAGAAAAECRSRGLDVATGPLGEDFLRARGPFDAVVMLDVIEHLASPVDVLESLARHTRPGGRLMITTGDWGAPLSRLMGRHWRLMTPPQHLWFHTTQSLSRLLGRTGFRVLDVEHPWKRVPLGLIAYQLGRLTRTQHVARRLDLGALGLPLNLFDAMRVVAVRS